MDFTAENINVFAKGEYLIRNNGGTASNGTNTPAVDSTNVATPEQLVRIFSPLKKPTGKKQSIIQKYISLLSNINIIRLEMINSMQGTHYFFNCK